MDVNQPQRMKPATGRNHVFLLVAAAAIAVAGALYVRHRIVTSPRYIVGQALADARYRQMDAEVAKLQADVQANPGSAQARWKLADKYQKLQLLDLARDQIEQIARIDPNSSAAPLALADIALALHDDASAEQQFRGMTQRWPKLVAGWQGLAAVLYREQHYTECLEAIDRAITLQPKNHNNHFILASALLEYARQYPNPEMYGPYVRVARKELEDLLPVWPDPADIHYRIGSACTILHLNAPALQHFEKAVQMQPDRPQFVVALADGYVGAGRRPDALKVVDAALARGLKTALLLDRQGQLVQTSSEPDAVARAVAAFSQAVKLDPQAEPFHEHLGSALVRAGKLDEARKEFEQAAQLNPQRPFPYQQLSAIYTRLGDSRRATAAAQMATHMVYNEQQLRHYEQLNAAYPMDVRLHLLVADRYRDLKMLSAARDKYEMVLRIQPGNQHAKQEIEKLKQPAQKVADRP